MWCRVGGVGVRSRKRGGGLVIDWLGNMRGLRF